MPKIINNKNKQEKYQSHLMIKLKRLFKKKANLNFTKTKIKLYFEERLLIYFTLILFTDIKLKIKQKKSS